MKIRIISVKYNISLFMFYTLLGDMFRLFLSHHQALFKIQILMMT